MLGVPWVHTFHTPWDRYRHYLPGGSLISDRVLGRWVSRFAAPAALVTTPSDRGREWVLVHSGRDPLVLSNPVDERFASGPSRSNSRARLGIPEDAGLLLMVGRVAAEKGSLSFLEAVIPDVARESNLLVALVGAGRQAEAIRRLADRWSVSDRILLPGAVPWESMGDWYRASDVFVSVSTSEFQSVAALEAMVSGLPVVCMDEQAFGARALVVPDQRAVWEAALSLLESGAGRGGFGEGVDDHRPATVAARWDEAYRKLI